MAADMTFLSYIPDALAKPVMVFDVQGTILYANRLASETLGYSTDDLRSITLSNLVPSQRRAARLLEWQNHVKAPMVTTIGRDSPAFVVCKDGSHKPVEVTFSPLVLPSGAQHIVAVFDILERASFDRLIQRQTTPAFARRKHHSAADPSSLSSPAGAEQTPGELNELLNDALHPIIGWRADGTIHIWNPGAEAVFGYDADEILGTSIARFWPPEMAEELNRRFSQTLAGSYVVLPDIKQPRKNGALVDVSVVSLPIHTPDGQIDGVVAVFHPLSPQHVTTREREQEFAVIAHEMKGPLAVIKSIVSGLADQPSVWAADDLAMYLAEVDAETDRLTGMLTDILDLAALTAGGFRFDPELCHLQDIVSSRRAMLSVFAQNHRLENVIPPELPRIWADFEQIGRVITNLITNAVNYSPPGTVVTLGAAAAEHTVRFWVSDQGPGIPEEEGPTIFGPFVRGSTGWQSGKRGNGIGLSLVKAIVDAHGGRIWFESRSGGGTTFNVILPAERPS